MSEVVPSTNVNALGQLLLARARAEGGRAVEVVIDQPGQRVVAMTFAQGSGLPEHDAPPAACLQACQGEMTLVAEPDRWVLGPGGLVPIPQQRHHLEAGQDSICLLTPTTVPTTVPTTR